MKIINVSISTLFLILVLLFTPTAGIAQYYFDPTSFMYQMQLQQQQQLLQQQQLQLQQQLQQQQQQIIQSTTQIMNDYYYEITPHIKFFTTDCKTLSLSICLRRTVSFKNVSATITDRLSSKTMSLSQENSLGDILVKVGGQDWNLGYQDVVVICFDNDKKWTYTLGENMSSADWSRYYQNELLSSINKYKQEHAQSQRLPATNQSGYYPIPVQQSIPDQNSYTQTSNKLRSNQIDAEISRLQNNLNNTQSSLSSNKQRDPSISNTMLIQSQIKLIDSYQRRISELQLEKSRLGY